MAGSIQFRRLVLMFDGTWNTRASSTNVSRMSAAIDNSKMVPDGLHVQKVKYLDGVGTSWEVFTKVAGGLGGYGLSRNIKEGYRWLSTEYQKDDEIYVFGFSRGAYSARSLVSLVHRCDGLLKKPEVGSAVDDAFSMYKSYVGTTDEHGRDKDDKTLNEVYAQNLDKFKKNHPTQEVKITMLGVWDTVGALGIPDSEFAIPFVNNMNPWSNKHYAFHDSDLSCIVKNAYHALAIDEHRASFTPTLWTKQMPQNEKVKQVWFAGSHCNVGGGAAVSGEDPDDLWQYSYIWMQEQAHKHGLRFYFRYMPSNDTEKVSAPTTNIPKRRVVSLTELEDSYSNFMKNPLVAVYSKIHGLFGGPNQFGTKLNRPMDGSNGAKLHWSVKERVEQSRDTYTPYRPANLHFSGVGTELKIQYGHDGEPWTTWPIEYDDVVDEDVVDDNSGPRLETAKSCSCKPTDEKQATSLPTEKYSKMK